jgi:hypothetical protein
LGQKIGLVVGIIVRFGAEEGERRYKAVYDVNHDDVIDLEDLVQVLLTPTCKKNR